MDLAARGFLVGLLALIAMLVLGIWNGVRWCRARHGSDDAWLGAGVIVAVVAVAASSNVAIYLTPPDPTPPSVGVLGAGGNHGPERARRCQPRRGETRRRRDQFSQRAADREGARGCL